MQIVSQQEKAALEVKREELYKAQLDVQDRIRKAASLGDLSENAEYHFAKEENRSIQQQLAELEKKLRQISVVSTDNVPDNVVFLGHTVKLLDLDDDSEQLVRIVGEAGAPDPNSDVMNVSVNSPMGEALMKARVGETVKVKAPRGTMEFKIVEIVNETVSASPSQSSSPSTSLPEYVIERLRRPQPEACQIIPFSTPVISFGNSAKARVATLGINPSHWEFVENGQELKGDLRRLATLTSLKVRTLTDAPGATLQVIVDECNGYFHRRPYKWFDDLEGVLKTCGASYLDDSACHLDLIQWATEKKWSELMPEVKRQLLLEDVPFLMEQLKHMKLELLLLNGRAVIDAFATATGVKLNERPEKVLTECSIVTGRTMGELLVVGWSTNLQSSYGVRTELRRAIAECIKDVGRREGALA